MSAMNFGSKRAIAVLDECIEETAPRLAEIALLAADYAKSRPQGQHREGYHAYERSTLDEALAAAKVRPDLTHEIWTVMASTVSELNRQLEALKAPAFEIVSYELFGALVEWRASADGFVAGPIPSPHQLN
ncbi:hypothetical protein [Rhizobium sp. SG741]|uniref:hypothetical protein n=1 Tax=Rhizobium sp. SG741 TaxID=2587114 RepID=UPI001446E97F|nr:hypothetical protein [Rhizobium sp. SG741]NKJ03734.1 hypothetical protein [Rhizobium sp. SG741]